MVTSQVNLNPFRIQKYVSVITNLILMVGPQKSRILALTHQKDRLQNHFFSLTILISFLRVYVLVVQIVRWWNFVVFSNKLYWYFTFQTYFKIQDWVYEWTMFFNLDRVHDDIVSRKSRKGFHLSLCFHNQATDKSVAY